MARHLVSREALFCFAVTVAIVLALPGRMSFSRVEGCATVSRKAQGSGVAIATESAVIIWEESRKIQHFIRRASFTTNAKDFGFLVPTPTKPTLVEAEDEIFRRLEKLTEPVIKTVKKTRWNWFPFAPGAGSRRKTDSAIRVLDRGRIGNLDYAVLEADSATELSQWLKEHDYKTRPALTKWLEQYVQKKWKITAFKIAKEEAEKYELATSAVQMTFQTEKPFFPYREPEDQKENLNDPRLLRIFFLASQRMEGRLGKNGPWPGKVEHAGPLPAQEQQAILSRLKSPPTRSGEWWLTLMDDSSSIRPGDEDVFFSVSQDQSQVRRPPILDVQYEEVPVGWVWCGMPLLIPLVIVLILWLRGRRGPSAKQG